MSVFVTGATGFIGSHLVNALVERGEKVHILIRSSLEKRPHQFIQTFFGDILDKISIARAMEGCDRMFHLAAYAKNWAKDSSTFEQINVDGLRNVLEEARRTKVRRIVFTSSSVTLGPSNGMPMSEEMPRTIPPFTEYERSKIMAERMALEYVAQGMNIVIVNPTRVFGPGLLNEGNSATRMIDWYLKGKWRLILGNGSGQGNYAFVDDVVDGHLRAMERGRAGERYLLGGENASFNEFFSLLADLSGKRYRMMYVSPKAVVAISHVEKFRAEHFNHYPLITPGWARTFTADWAFSVEKARRELGYTVTTLRTALERTVTWLREQYKNGERP